MIVVDTNVMAYLWIECDRTGSSFALLRNDPDWHAPRLWRSEFRNVLATTIKAGRFDVKEARRIASKAEARMSGREHDVDSSVVLELASRSGRSAYDCEFVALAQRLGVPLLTADRRLAAAFPSIAVPLA